MIGAVITSRLRQRQIWRSLSGIFRQTDRVFSTFELWPGSLFYLPLVGHWILLSLRYRSLTLPMLANPGMQAGGLVGESKSEILSQVGKEGRKWLAPYTCFTVGLAAGAPTTDLPQALAALETAGIEFPFVAKPDIGCRGAGVCVISDEDQLERYLAGFPRRERVIFQTLVEASGEAGVFYVRAPGEPRGRIVSLTLKFFPTVVGDGSSTLEELILADPRARRIRHIYLRRHAEHRDRILAPGESFPLVFAGNHCRGAIFRDGSAHITHEMTERFEAIARGMPEFYFGRFDVRYDSLEDFKRGENLTIIEVNGAGSESTHIWDRNAQLRDAYRALFYQQQLLFEFGAANRARGFSPVGFFPLLRLWSKQARLTRSYRKWT